MKQDGNVCTINLENYRSPGEALPREVQLVDGRRNWHDEVQCVEVDLSFADVEEFCCQPC